MTRLSIKQLICIPSQCGFRIEINYLSALSTIYCLISYFSRSLWKKCIFEAAIRNIKNAFTSGPAMICLKVYNIIWNRVEESSLGCQINHYLKTGSPPRPPSVADLSPGAAGTTARLNHSLSLPLTTRAWASGVALIIWLCLDILVSWVDHLTPNICYGSGWKKADQCESAFTSSSAWATIQRWKSFIFRFRTWFYAMKYLVVTCAFLYSGMFKQILKMLLTLLWPFKITEAHGSSIHCSVLIQKNHEKTKKAQISPLRKLCVISAQEIRLKSRLH